MDPKTPNSHFLVLASASPRRRDLLGMLEIPFRVQTSGVNEKVLDQTSPESYTSDAAELKARAVARLCEPGTWVLGADTTVVLDGQVLGKPQDRAQAQDMLGRLSGRTHEVLTGVCLLCAGKDYQDEFLASTQVTFRKLDPSWIHAYLATGEPMDKAGAYGIQGKGAILVRSINGSYTNVVGLPLSETVDLLERAGVWVPFYGGGS